VLKGGEFEAVLLVYAVAAAGSVAVVGMAMGQYGDHVPRVEAAIDAGEAA